MFDVGFSELVLLFVIGLLILGPERLPRVASKLGRWMGKARRTAHQLRMQLEREMTMNDIMREKKERERQSAESGATANDAGGDAPAPPADDANDSGHHDAGAEDSPESPADTPPSGATAPGAADTAAAAEADEVRQRQA